MRKETTVHITAEGRDKDKVFVIREMSARAVERWGARLAFALQNAGVDIPVNNGMAGLAQTNFGGLGRLQFADFEPLLDEMMSCISIARDPAHTETTSTLIEDDIEEVPTLLKLRWETLQLHVGFLPAAVRSRMQLMAANLSAAWSNIQTSQPASEPSSPPAKQP